MCKEVHLQKKTILTKAYFSGLFKYSRGLIKRDVSEFTCPLALEIGTKDAKC